MTKLKKPLALTIIVFISSFFFFSLRLLDVPKGLTIDEIAFGYNGVIISETFRDETSRFAPIFALSINGKDWRQPVMQYFIVGFFKFFGPNLYNLKLTSVVIASLSSVLIFILGKKLLGNLGAIMSVILFATTPIILIHSHLALDNIMTIPFTLLWLLTFYWYEKTKNPKFLIGAGITLGIGFYSYKGMRSFVPIWSLLTLIYIAQPLIDKKTASTLAKIKKPLTIFITSILPFYIVIPLLERKYAGAVLGQVNIGGVGIYGFFRSYLSSFDPSFLFITGDEILNHSTGRHGMFLLATLPFFILGLVQVFKKGGFWILIAVSFFTGPLLFGFPGSIHRASRLIALSPFFILIATLGFSKLYENLKKYKWLLITLVMLFVINASDFLNYYWFSYADDTFPIFYHSGIEPAYKALDEKSAEKNLTPLVDSTILKAEKTDEGYINTFYRSIYFTSPPQSWTEDEQLPESSILLTRNSELKGLKKVEDNLNGFYLYTKN